MKQADLHAPIKTGLASYGMSGMVFHAPFIDVNPRFELTAILERSKELSADHCPHARIVRTYGELLGSGVDLVVVNTPDRFHYDMVRQALMAGKHVVVEKPFVMETGQGEELIRLAREKGLLLSVYQNRRWDGDFMTVKQLVENQVLGRLVEFTSHYDRYRNYIEPGTWKEDGQAGTGVLYNLGTHMVDHALQLFGMPKKVYAHARVVRTGGQVPDNFDMKLYYDGLDVNLRCSYLAREAGPRFLLHGTGGSYIKYGIDPQEAALKAGALPQGADWGKEPEQEWGYLNTDREGLHYEGSIETLPGNYMAYYDNIADALAQGAELAVKPEESMDGLHLIEAARESIARQCLILL